MFYKLFFGLFSVFCIIFICSGCSAGASAEKPPERITEPVTAVVTEPNEAAAAQIKTLPATKEDILRAYSQAVNEVKLRSPGFTMVQQENCRDVTANSDAVLLQWNAFLHAAVRSFRQCVAPGDDVACRTFFPVFDTDFGCRLTDPSLIQNAVCRESGCVRTLRLTFRSTEENGDSFAQLQKCVSLRDGDTVLRMLARSVPGLREDAAEVTQKCMYCEIECRTDVLTGKMLSLKQKTVCEYLVCARVELPGADTPFLARTSVIRHLRYSDFIW